MLLLVRLTVKAPTVEVLRLIVPVAAFGPAASLKVLGFTVKVRVGIVGGVGVTVGPGVGVAATPTSVTVTRVRPGANPEAVAVRPTT